MDNDQTFAKNHGSRGLDSPVKDVFDITIHVHPEEELRVGTARPVAVGAIIGIRDDVSAVVSLLPVDFVPIRGRCGLGHPPDTVIGGANDNWSASL